MVSTAPDAVGTSVPATLGERIGQISERFDASGVLGLLAIEARMLDQIEANHGAAARVRSLCALYRLVRELGEERLDVDDLVLSTEVGSSAIVVVLFREQGDARFYSQELPSFAQAVVKALERRGKEIFYPYVRGASHIDTGISATIRNPKFSVESQLHSGLAEARADAELKARTAARGRRERFIELLLEQKVTSVYEPIVDCTSRTVFGYEALARGPEGSELHSPVVLFRAAGEENLVFALDCLCRSSGLEGAIGLPSGTKLFLNVLPTAIHDPNFRADRLIRTLERCQLSPCDVVFEISEQESISNFEAFREIRDSYRDLGFQFALDDTGAGYAGLEALLEISPEFIKMDRAMVSGVDQDSSRQVLLSALLTVADKIGARVIGEGLDTIEELEMLRELGIHFGQGWLFGHPTPLRARPPAGL